MRCLYCGKHLPLLRKLTGGGEFCSDAHRDNYHEEYNRLAVSRLLQAQSRPEEPKPSPSAAVETHDVAVVVAEEPEVDELSGSFIEEFSIQQIRPAAARTQVEIEVAPVFLSAPEPGDHPFLPAIDPASFAPRMEAGFLASRPGLHAVAMVPAEIGPPPAHDVEQVFPIGAGIRSADRQPVVAGALALNPPSTPRSSKMGPFELGVSAMELTQPDVAMPTISSGAHGRGLPRAGSLRLELWPTAVAEDSTLEVGLIETFPGLVKLRPAFDLRMKLLDTTEIALPEPLYQAAVNGRAEVVPISPRRVLEALSLFHAERKQKEPQEPPLSRTMKPLVIAAVAPIAEVPTIGFDSVLFAAKPRLLRHSIQPLRPKVAIGTAAGPLPVRSGRTGLATGRDAAADQGKNGTSKIMPRSMLHLDTDTGAADSDSETPSLFGKLGGLFGKKSRAGRQEVGSKK